MVSTCFKAHVRTDDDSELAGQILKWNNLGSDGAYKQVDPRSAADARALRIFENPFYHDGSCYHFGILWADDDSSLPKNYFSALVLLNSLERCPESASNLKHGFSKTIRIGFFREDNLQVEQFDCFKADFLCDWNLPNHPVLHPCKRGKVRLVLNAAAKFQSRSLNNALLTTLEFLQNLLHVHVLLVSSSTNTQSLQKLRVCSNKSKLF